VARVFDRAGHVNRETGAVESFVYDAAGNLTREWTAGAAYRTNTWDAANRLTKIDPASGDDAVLTYDPLGRIATRTVGTAATTTYRYAGTSDIVVREAAGSATSYLATPAGARMGTSDGTTAHWLLYDLLGSVVASQAAGSGTTSLVDALRYDAYGQTLGQHQATGSDLGPRFRGLLDLAPTADRDVSGPGSDPLYQMGARAYAPHLGTFTKLDTYAGRAQEPISLNRYLYAHANPATLIDPSGHAPCKAGKKCAQGSDRVSVVDAHDNATVYSGGQQVGSSSGGGGGGGTSSTGHPSAGGSVPPATPPPDDDFWGNLLTVFDPLTHQDGFLSLPFEVAGVCLGVGAGAPGLYASSGTCLVVDERGNFAFANTDSKGIGTGLDGTLAAGLIFSTAPELDDLAGGSLAVGGSANGSFVAGAGLDVSTAGAGSNSEQVFTFQGGLQFGGQETLGIPGELHGLAGQSVVDHIDPIGWLRQQIANNLNVWER
jgi:RHS repeat-associated protein